MCEKPKNSTDLKSRCKIPVTLKNQIPPRCSLQQMSLSCACKGYCPFVRPVESLHPVSEWITYGQFVLQACV